MVKEIVDYKSQVPIVVDHAVSLMYEEFNDPKSYDTSYKRYYEFQNRTQDLRPIVSRVGLRRLITRLSHLITRRGIALVDVRDLPGAYGSCSVDGVITLREGLYIGKRFQTMLHEYAHWLLNHCLESAFGLDEATAQIQAESISFLISAYMSEYDHKDILFLRSYSNDNVHLAKQYPVIKQTAISIIEEIEPWNIRTHVLKGEEFDATVYTKIFDYEIEIGGHPASDFPINEGIYANWEDRLHAALLENPDGLTIGALSKITGLLPSQVQRNMQFRDRNRIALMKKASSGRVHYYKAREYVSD